MRPPIFQHDGATEQRGQLHIPHEEQSTSRLGAAATLQHNRESRVGICTPELPYVTAWVGVVG